MTLKKWLEIQNLIPLPTDYSSLILCQDYQCEDYGQSATYLGTVSSSPNLFWLDDHHAFEIGRPERICANTAAMLSETRYAKHFKILGEKQVHYGAFDCAATMAAQQYGGKNNSTDISGCC